MSEAAVRILELAAAAASLAGAFFYLASAVGLVRFPDFFCRVHAPTKAATLGITFLAGASALRSFARRDAVWVEDLLIIVFLWITIPVSSQILMRAAARRGEPGSANREEPPSQ